MTNISEQYEEYSEGSSEESSYNDSNVQYSTEFSRRGAPRYEEVQVRFNNILQKREQLKENLTGSQIVHVLDYYIDRGFDLVAWSDAKDGVLLEALQKEYLVTIKTFIANRRKLFSIRYSNEEVYDVLVELFFEKDVKVFCKRFLNIKLNREVYLNFLDRVFASDMITNKDSLQYFTFYRKQYTEIKNLLLGNYIRYAFTETNKFFDYYKDRTTLEAKEDYFSGLMLVILRVIDKYDSFKGTLTSFIENWFKDYRTTFKARQLMIDGSIDIEDEATLHECSNIQGTIEDDSVRETSFRKQLIEKILEGTSMDLVALRATVAQHREHFPSITMLLEASS